MKFLLAVICVSISMSAFGGWSGPKPITMIYPQVSSPTILFKQNSPSPDECPGASGQYYSLTQDHPNYETTYSLLLMAYTTQESVNINLGGCTSEGHTKINQVIIEKII